MGWVAGEDGVVVGAVGDDRAEGAAPDQLEDAAFGEVGFAGCAGEDEAGGFVPTLSQEFCRQERDDGPVGMGDHPKRGRRWKMGDGRWPEEQLQLVGEGAGEGWVFDPTVPAREGAGA